MQEEQAKCKSTDALELAREYGEKVFSEVYPEKVDMKGKSLLKSLVAEQMLSTVLTDVSVRFRSRCVKLCLLAGSGKKSSALRAVDSAFFGRWQDVPSSCEGPLRRVLPENPANTFYDLKARPERYFAATAKLCREIGEESCKFSFCPTRSSCVPCHCKFDTEAMAQLLLPYKTCVEERKARGKDGRKEYNDWVWNAFVDRKKVDSKLKKFRFHHEMTTDGVAVSLLYSREVQEKEGKNASDFPKHPRVSEPLDEERYPGRHVGVDPGKSNLVTMTDSSGISLRYTCRQRRFEGKLPRYLKILEAEKAKANGVLQAERDLSERSRKTNDHDEFLAYLREKKLHDYCTAHFYLQEKWRGWKFRLYCSRKKSEDLFANRVERAYGKDCVIHYGDWSRKEQMKGCVPSLGVGMKKLLEKRFALTEVDEFKTSKTCNLCFGEMKRYRKKYGKLSYSRLCCDNCAGCPKDRSKRFADRDLNAAANILLIGTSEERPSVFRRSQKRKRTEESTSDRVNKIKLSVDAEGTLSDSLCASIGLK